MCLSGFGFWSHDISGFEQTAPAGCVQALGGVRPAVQPQPSARLQLATGCRGCSMRRAATCCGSSPRLKCRLMPYLYAAAVEAHEHGTPMMRPMMLEFPDDPACDTLDRQYMTGRKSAGGSRVPCGQPCGLLSARRPVDAACWTAARCRAVIGRRRPMTSCPCR